MCKSEQTIIKTSINLTRRGKACAIVRSTMLVFFSYRVFKGWRLGRLLGRLAQMSEHSE